VKWEPTPKLRLYVLLIALGVVGALMAGRPEPVVLAVPFAVAVGVGLASTGSPTVSVTTRLEDVQRSEGERTTLHLEVTAVSQVPSVEILVTVPLGLTCPRADRLQGVELDAGEVRQIDVPIGCDRWGTFRMGEVRVRVRSLFGLLQSELFVPASEHLAVHPAAGTLRRVVRTSDTQAAAGNQLAIVRAPGIDFADVREFRPGDRVKDVNWRATARRGVMWVNDRNPDRSTDVVLFVDTFGPRTLAAAVRASHSLAEAYLSGRDRVGLITFGGTVAWVRPRMGLRQQYLIVDALLSAAVFENQAWKGIDVLPRRVLPPKALVVAVTPMEDQRVLTALVDMRARGIDVVTVEVSPVPYNPRGRAPVAQLAHRMWVMEREAQRDRYQSMGMPVVEWTEDKPIAVAVEELRLLQGRRALR
jgi:uncharacterized protein (DUF58 family)